MAKKEVTLSNDVKKDLLNDQVNDGGHTTEQQDQNKAVVTNTSKKIEPDTLISTIFKYYLGADEKTRQSRKECHDVISQYLKQTVAQYACAANYNIVLMFDDTRIVRTDSDKIYDAVAKFQSNDKPLLLVLHSPGGAAGSAYLIAKLCREYTSDKFVVAVPRIAKSAATLLCCGADEIHMGSLSELGPIDPQIDDLPALGLKNSIEHIADLVSSKPNTAELFAKYLNLSLPLINLGYYERVAESAKQYAIRLLNNNTSNLPNSPVEIAHNLVYNYKDHGFVIDKTEALSIFGNHIIKSNTEEYELANNLYRNLDFIQNITKYTNHRFYYVGKPPVNHLLRV